MQKQKKIKTIVILLPLARENLTGFLSPILGQYGIRNSDFLAQFVQEFNKLTENVYADDLEESLEDSSSSLLSEFDLTVPVKITIFKGNRFELSLQTPHMGYLLSRTYESISSHIEDIATYFKINYVRYAFLHKSFLENSNDLFFCYSEALKHQYKNFRKANKI